MPDHERPRRPLLICEGQELDSKLTHHVAVERYKASRPTSRKERSNNNSGSSGGSPSASACSISKRALSTAALVSGAA